MSVTQASVKWARPVLDQMGLSQSPAIKEILNSHRVELERSQFLDRIRAAVTQMNREAGRQIIESQEFLPPARLVIRLRHARGRTDYCLEIVVREEGPKAVFYTIKKSSRGLLRIFGGANNRISKAYSSYFQPEPVREAEVQSWIAFVLSEFKSEFRPEIDGYRKIAARPDELNTGAGLLDTA